MLSIKNIVESKNKTKQNKFLKENPSKRILLVAAKDNNTPRFENVKVFWDKILALYGHMGKVK